MIISQSIVHTDYVIATAVHFYTIYSDFTAPSSYIMLIKYERFTYFVALLGKF